MSKKALGKGLGALISNFEFSTISEILEIPIEQISPNPEQPRKHFDEKKLAELASSIKEKGVIQPIFARKSDDGYIIIAGERRWRAAKQVELKTLPVIIKNISEQEELEISLIENLQREDINPIEEGEAYQRLTEIFNYTQDNLATVLGKDKSTISNTLRLLKLEEAIKEHIRQGCLTMGHARALLSIPDPVNRLIVCKQIIQQGLSVRQTENLVKQYGAGTKEKKKDKDKDKDKETLFIKSLEDELKSLFGTYVKIKNEKEMGIITIKYSSLDELERIISLMKE